MKIYFFTLIFCLVGLVKCSSETTFLINQTPATLTLNYYTNIFGNFVNYPPQTVPAYGNVTWSMDGDIVHHFGQMAYEVYYQSSSFNGCADFSYLWDLAFGICKSGFFDCPSNKNKTISVKHKLYDCYFFIKDDCGTWSNPIHYLTTNCSEEQAKK